MARVVSVGILPDGTLSRTPTSKAAGFLRARYTGIRVGEHEMPFTAMKVFRRADPSRISRRARALSIRIRRSMPRRAFEGDIVEFPGGVGIRRTINGRALARIAKACARSIRATPARLPKILAAPGAPYTHVLASPDAYTACMESMGWDIYPTFLDPLENALLRTTPKGRAHGLASLRLAVAIDYTVSGGSVYCVDARNMLFAMGHGRATYDYAREELLIEQEYYLDASRAGRCVEVVISPRHLRGSSASGRRATA